MSEELKQEKPKAARKPKPKKQDGRGRPWRKIDIALVEEGAARGLNLKEIALTLGVSVSTLQLRRNIDEDVDLAWERGRAKGISIIQNKIWTHAVEKDNLAAQFFYMKTHGGRKEGQALEVSGPEGGPIKVETSDAKDRLREKFGVPTSDSAGE